MTTKQLVSLAEAAWLHDKSAHGWKLPKPARWPLRLPIVRFFRAAWLDVKAERFARQFDVYGIGRAHSGYDAWVMYAVARGWC